jgi:hypothetical protein
MELSPSREATSYAAAEKLLCFTEAKDSLPCSLVFSLSQINPAHTTPSYLSKIRLDIIHPSTSWSS